METPAVVSHLQIQAGDGDIFSFPPYLQLFRLPQSVIAKYLKFQAFMRKDVLSDHSHYFLSVLVKQITIGKNGVDYVIP